jgi:hypothetical protein
LRLNATVVLVPAETTTELPVPHGAQPGTPRSIEPPPARSQVAGRGGLAEAVRNINEAGELLANVHRNNGSQRRTPL